MHVLVLAVKGNIGTGRKSQISGYIFHPVYPFDCLHPTIANPKASAVAC